MEAVEAKVGPSSDVGGAMCSLFVEFLRTGRESEEPGILVIHDGCALNIWDTVRPRETVLGIFRRTTRSFKVVIDYPDYPSWVPQ